jgi:hypothetical protein
MKKGPWMLMFLLFSVEAGFCLSSPFGRQKFENGFTLNIKLTSSSGKGTTVILLKNAADETELCTIAPEKYIPDAEEVAVWDATVSKAGNVAVVAVAGKGDYMVRIILVYDKNGKLLRALKPKPEDGSAGVFAAAYDVDNTIWALSRCSSKLPAGAKVLYHMNEGGDILGGFYSPESVTNSVNGIRSSTHKGVFSFGLTSKHIYFF